MSASARLTGDRARDELLLSLDESERRAQAHTRASLRSLEFGLGLGRRQLRELREALADAAVLRHLVRALDAADREVSP
ncbi:MAG: hypothetical protein M3680_02850 [Myxococcota bacterium]|nr:hypothetical protein [Myxococcota bacterium]